MTDLEQVLGRVLSIGVAVSTAALAAGLVVTGVSGGGVIASRLLTAGILILIATPAARVVVSSVAYARRRDWTFVLLTLIVLGELLASLIAAVRR